jgi:hypothetical protein
MLGILCTGLLEKHGFWGVELGVKAMFAKGKKHPEFR